MTIRELVQMAEEQGYSMDTVIHPLGADVKYIKFGRHNDNIEYVVLDECPIDDEEEDGILLMK